MSRRTDDSATAAAVQADAAETDAPGVDEWPWLAVGLLATAFAAIYIPDVGHGFVKDDFVWIARSRIRSLTDVVAIFGAPTGFFRPVVSLSFAANAAVCGVAPLCYGLTNLALAAGCAVAIGWLAVSLGLRRGAAVAAGAIWAFNVHGINMATLWISGRTSLLLTLLALLAAAAFVRGRYVAAAALALAAMGSKEEAVALPAIVIGWAILVRHADDTRERGSPRASGAVLLVLATVIYASLRAFSGAFTPGSAPGFYRLGFTLGRVVSNVAPYADRSLTVAAGVCLLYWIVARPRTVALAAPERRAALLGGLWAIGGFALTIFLPIRSSLYACFPSAGIAIAAGAWLSAAWRPVSSAGRTRAIAAGLVLPFVLWWPVYRARNTRLVREAELSRHALAAIADLTDGRPRPMAIVLEDDPTARPALDTAFGTLAQEAVGLIVGPGVRVAIHPPPTDASLAGLESIATPDAVLQLQDGALVRVR